MLDPTSKAAIKKDLKRAATISNKVCLFQGHPGPGKASWALSLKIAAISPIRRLLYPNSNRLLILALFAV
jgi:hypothetical protein